MKNKIFKNLIIFFVILNLTACQNFDNHYNPNNLMANLDKANILQFANGYADEIFIPDKNNNIEVGNISAESYYVSSMHRKSYDYIKYKDPYKQLPIASLTKLMTALIVFENEEDLDKIYTVPAEATDLEKLASKANLLVGDKLTVRDLLYALLLPSGNDAALAIAYNLAGSVDNFVLMMNNEAQRLGALHTHFVNPTGLSSNFHYSSSYDIYLIVRELLKYDTFSQISTTKQYEAQITQNDGIVRKSTWTSTNFFVMGDMAISDNVLIVGGKTGYTENAGDCLCIISKSKKNEEEYISVVLNATSKSNTYRNTNALLSGIE